jgi:hypothetical protein
MALHIGPNLPMRCHLLTLITETHSEVRMMTARATTSQLISSSPTTASIEAYVAKPLIWMMIPLPRISFALALSYKPVGTTSSLPIACTTTILAFVVHPGAQNSAYDRRGEGSAFGGVITSDTCLGLRRLVPVLVNKLIKPCTSLYLLMGLGEARFKSVSII